MNTAAEPDTLPWWSRQPHLLLAGHLLLLHALAFGGWQLPAVRILWFVALGLFLLWQPFVAGEQRMSPRQVWRVPCGPSLAVSPQTLSS